MPSQKLKFGDLGEREAENFLVSKGYRIVVRNYRIKNLGEIDLVGERRRKLFFFEVKTRDLKYELNFPIGFSIYNKKRRNLKRICQLYLVDKRLPLNKEWQVDAIFVKFDFVSNNHLIEHLENILWERYY